MKNAKDIQKDVKSVHWELNGKWTMENGEWTMLVEILSDFID